MVEMAERGSPRVEFERMDVWEGFGRWVWKCVMLLLLL